MSDLDPLRNLAQTLTTDPGQPVTMTKGVVTDLYLAGVPPTCEVQLSGDTTTKIAGVRFIDSYTPVIGDVVQIIKQGPMLLVLGQIAAGSGNPATVHQFNGWAEPMLLSGWGQHSADPVMYRLVLDNGSKKVQLRGRMNLLTGTSVALFDLPAACRPATNLGNILVAREVLLGGTHATQIEILNTGRINIVQPQAGVASVGTATSSTAPGSGQPVGAFGVDQAGVPTTNVVYNPPGGNITTDHRHAMPHSHNVNGHNHNVTVNAPTFPGYISFNGIEYFI